MHGLGNDFVVIDAINQSIDLAVDLDADRIRQLADRHFGIGFDQLLLVESAARRDVDFNYRIFNADGSEVEQCGNGARCFAKYVRSKGFTDKTRIQVATLRGNIELQITDNGEVCVDMGCPDFSPAALPFDQKHTQSRYQLDIDGSTVEFGAVSMGNPHVVIQVDDINEAPVSSLGAVLEGHRTFPNRVNVGFMQVVDKQHLRLRVFERGVGETLACGTGACAAMAVAQQWGQVDNQVTVSLAGGSLCIDWQPGQSLKMIGPASFVFEGSFVI